MASLRSIIASTAQVAVPFGSETINVCYRPHYLTPAFEDRFNELRADGKATEMAVQLFTTAVESWDLSWDEGGEPIPLTVDGLKDVPTDILSLVLKAVSEAASPNPTTEPNCALPSQPMVG